LHFTTSSLEFGVLALIGDFSYRPCLIEAAITAKLRRTGDFTTKSTSRGRRGSADDLHDWPSVGTEYKKVIAFI